MPPSAPSLSIRDCAAGMMRYLGRLKAASRTERAMERGHVARRTKGWPNPALSLSAGKREQGLRREGGGNVQVASNCPGREGAISHPLLSPSLRSSASPPAGRPRLDLRVGLRSAEQRARERPTDELWPMWDARLGLRPADRPTAAGAAPTAAARARSGASKLPFPPPPSAKVDQS